MWDGWRRVRLVHGDRQRLYGWGVSLWLWSGLRTRPAVLERDVRLRFDVVPVGMLLRFDLCDGHHLWSVRDQRQRVHRVWHQCRSLSQRQL